MRYELDANGYVLNTYFGCCSSSCQEYTGTVPTGYKNLVDWSENAIINTYYIDEDGNLILDADRLADLEERIEQDTIDNQPLVYKDLYGTNDVLDAQYEEAEAEGKVIEIDRVKKINPKVLITGIECYKDTKIDIVTQGRQMLKNEAKSESISGVSFVRKDGYITFSGQATEDIEYNIAGSSTNTTPIFALKGGVDYRLNLGGHSCIMRFYDGTTNVVYEGVDGTINLPENKMVTQVVLKVKKDLIWENETIRPTLNLGTIPLEYEEYKTKKLTIDFSDYKFATPLFPSDDLYPSDDLFPSGDTVDYVYIENGIVYISINGIVKYLTKANVNLFDGYNLVYTMQDTYLGMTYNINNLKLEGTTTKNNNFRVLEDGSIEAHNGYFSGTLEADSGNVGGWVINANGLTNGKVVLNSDGSSTIYTVADLIIIRGYLMGYTGFALSNAMIKHYDLNGDGVVTSADYMALQKLIGIVMD